MSHWQIPIAGQLVQLRPLRPEDFETLYAAASDPLIWEQHPDRLRYERGVFQKYFDSAIEAKNQGGGAYLIQDAKTQAVIGSSRFCNPAPGLIEIGYTFLTRLCWGRGYNRELKGLMLRHAFEKVETVHFVVGENNHRSRTAMLKIGGKLADHRESSVIFKITKSSGVHEKL